LNTSPLVVIRKKEKKITHDNMDKQSDKIMQNILNASKLLEGRFTFDQLIELDIPNFENIVNNEFANIDSSYEAFNKQGTINAYTKNEIMNMDTKVLQEFNRKTTI
jgi:hypothetical protein